MCREGRWRHRSDTLIIPSSSARGRWELAEGPAVGQQPSSQSETDKGAAEACRRSAVEAWRSRLLLPVSAEPSEPRTSGRAGGAGGPQRGPRGHGLLGPALVICLNTQWGRFLPPRSRQTCPVGSSQDHHLHPRAARDLARHPETSPAASCCASASREELETHFSEG